MDPLEDGLPSLRSGVEDDERFCHGGIVAKPGSVGELQGSCGRLGLLLNRGGCGEDGKHGRD